MTSSSRWKAPQNVARARQCFQQPTKDGLARTSLDPVRRARRARASSGRQQSRPCIAVTIVRIPQFIDRSLDNFFNWLTAESLAEIHPIEKAALVLDADRRHLAV